MKLKIALSLAFMAIAPISAMAETPEERNACMDDAFNVCGHAIPDRDRVAACLHQNVSKISPACRAVMARHPKPTSTTERFKAASR